MFLPAVLSLISCVFLFPPSSVFCLLLSFFSLLCDLSSRIDFVFLVGSEGAMLCRFKLWSIALLDAFFRLVLLFSLAGRYCWSHALLCCVCVFLCISSQWALLNNG